MKKQIVIVGLGRFGVSLAIELSKRGHEILALDTDERKVQSIVTQITHAIHADATDESVLNELGVRNFEIAIVAIGSNIQSSVLSAIQLKSMGIPYIIARANNKSHGEILKKIGADKVVFPEDEAGYRLAHEIQLGDALDILPVSPKYDIAIVKAEQEITGQTLTELGIGPRGKERIAVLLIQRGNEIIVTPAMSEIIKPSDKLIISGSDDKLESFLKRITANRTG